MVTAHYRLDYEYFSEMYEGFFIGVQFLFWSRNLTKTIPIRINFFLVSFFSDTRKSHLAWIAMCTTQIRYPIFRIFCRSKWQEILYEKRRVSKKSVFQSFLLKTSHFLLDSLNYTQRQWQVLVRFENLRKHSFAKHFSSLYYKVLYRLFH